MNTSVMERIIVSLLFLAAPVLLLWFLYTISKSLVTLSEAVREIRDLLRDRSASRPPLAG